MSKQLADYVIDILDYPKKGIVFRDVTGILESPAGYKLSIDELENAVKSNGLVFDKIAAVEARGFIFGAALADRLGVAFVPVRKPGKLPRDTISESYDLEYGSATVHLHKGSIKPGERVLVLDDLLATGGTAAAAAHLVEKEGGVVAGMLFVLELLGFNARETNLKGYAVFSLVQYPGK